jgi:predicted nucleic acid-binding protein
MSGDRAFVDTNVLVYAHDASAGIKRDQARSLLIDLWESGRGCISVQVLQEFFVTVTRKVPEPLDVGTAVAVISDLSRWRVHSPSPEDVVAAAELHGRHRVSFWDAMILRSAAALGCRIVYSEDLNHGQDHDGVGVFNPFV